MSDDRCWECGAAVTGDFSHKCREPASSSKSDLACDYHEPETTCDNCGLEIDQYGNTEDSFINCCFPDCGCDGARNCSAPSGANYCSTALNLEKGSIGKNLD